MSSPQPTHSASGPGSIGGMRRDGRAIRLKGRQAMGPAIGQPAELTGTRSPIIGIVGLGAMGRAIAHGLQRAKSGFEVWGHDREPERVREAKRAMAIDKGDWNLVSVAERADLLYVTEPLEELLDTLPTIAPHMRQGSIVTDTASLKAPVIAAVDRCFPVGVSFVGGHPVLNRADQGDDASRLVGATYCLVPHPAADDKAVRAVSRLASAFGARPFYIDAREHDALIAGVSHLPYLVEMSLVRVLGGSPSASDLRKLAGPHLPGAIASLEKDRSAVSTTVHSDQSGLVSWLDQLLTSLGKLRDAVAAGDWEQVEGLLADAEEIGAGWKASGADHTVAAGGFDDVDEYGAARHLFFGGWRRRGTQ